MNDYIIDFIKHCSDCGHIYHVDPCTEENLYWDGVEEILKEQCPKCGRKEGIKYE